MHYLKLALCVVAIIVGLNMLVGVYRERDLVKSMVGNDDKMKCPMNQKEKAIHIILGLALVILPVLCLIGKKHLNSAFGYKMTNYSCGM